MPALGGSDRTVGEIVMESAGVGGYLAWSPDGKWLIVSDGNPVAGLILISTITGEGASHRAGVTISW